MSLRTRRGLATWLMSSRTPLFVLDDRRVVLVFNLGCEEFTQWSAADVIGKACIFQNDPNPERVASLTGALCPPDHIDPETCLRRRALFHRRDGSVLERDIYYFPLQSDGEQAAPHLLGIITACADSPALAVSPHLDVARHTAELYAKYQVDRLITNTPAMQRVAAQIDLARSHPASVHLVGERGSGREHVARLIHYAGTQRTQRFVPIRCATASHFELNRILRRLVETAPPDDDVGTVYLDDVTLLPGDLQPLVLAGCARTGRRWISSSQQSLDKIPEEAFQPDLLARLTALPITIPPLRARSADLPLLAQQLLEECNTGRTRQHTEFAPAVLRLFQQHAWPGNVDELSQVVSKACERSSTTVIEVADLPLEFIASLQARSIRPLPHAVSLDEQLAEFARTRILTALKETRGNKSMAADQLGIPRAKLYRRMEQLGLVEFPDDESETSHPET